jgi:hypothetical protein
MAADPYAVGDADEDQPPEHVHGGFEGPTQAVVEYVTHHDLAEGHEGHEGEEEGNDALLQPFHDPGQHVAASRFR